MFELLNKIRKSIRKYWLNVKWGACIMPHHSNKQFPEYMEYVRGYKLSEEELAEQIERLENPPSEFERRMNSADEYY